MISSFISSYSFSTLFIKVNSSWLIFESIRDLESNPSILLNLDFGNNTIYHAFFSFFLIIEYSLIPAVFAQIFNPIAELVIPIEISVKEAKPEMETHPVIAEAK